LSTLTDLLSTLAKEAERARKAADRQKAAELAAERARKEVAKAAKQAERERAAQRKALFAARRLRLATMKKEAEQRRKAIGRCNTCNDLYKSNRSADREFYNCEYKDENGFDCT
jgi:hypothetical protein